jgi:16S rRNA G966 N2-methylase RsmD
MKKGSQEVFTTQDKKRVCVGVAKFDIFDTVAEAISTLGEARTLSLINIQNKTSTCNAMRASATAGMSKKAIRNEAMQLLLADPEWNQKVLAVRGDAVQMQRVIEEAEAFVEQLHKNQQMQRLEAAAADDQEEATIEGEDELDEE